MTDNLSDAISCGNLPGFPARTRVEKEAVRHRAKNKTLIPHLSDDWLDTVRGGVGAQPRPLVHGRKNGHVSLREIYSPSKAARHADSAKSNGHPASSSPSGATSGAGPAAAPTRWR